MCIRDSVKRAFDRNCGIVWRYGCSNSSGSIYYLSLIHIFFWLGLGIINGVLLANRVTPFTGPDLHLITDAVKIANKYLNPFFFVIVMIIAILVLIAMIILFVKGPRYRRCV